MLTVRFNRIRGINLVNKPGRHRIDVAGILTPQVGHSSGLCNIKQKPNIQNIAQLHSFFLVTSNELRSYFNLILLEEGRWRKHQPTASKIQGPSF